MGLTPGTPNTIMKYLASQGGVQNANRFHVYFTGPDGTLDFLAENIQLPTKKLKAFSNQLSGSAAPIPIPFGVDYGTVLVTLVVEESWRSRTFFENWMNKVFNTSPLSRGQSLSQGIGNLLGTIPPLASDTDYMPSYNKVGYYDDIAGKVKIQALSVQGNTNTGETLINREYNLYGCFPIQFVPVNMDEKQMNTALRFQVNIAYSYYTYK